MMMVNAFYEHGALEHSIRDELSNLASRQTTNESDFQISSKDKKSRLNNEFTQGVSDEYLKLSLTFTFVVNPNSKCCEYLTRSFKASKWEASLFISRGFKKLLEFS